MLLADGREGVKNFPSCRGEREAWNVRRPLG